MNPMIRQKLYLCFALQSTGLLPAMDNLDNVVNSGIDDGWIEDSTGMIKLTEKGKRAIEGFKRLISFENTHRNIL